MNLNITKNQAKFIVNEEARKVICIFEGTSDMFINYIDQNSKISPTCDSLWGYGELYPKLTMPNKFIGIASCDPEDEFSIETGKMIAYSRAKDKIHKSFFKRANTYINTIDDWLTEAVVNINQYGDKIERNTARRHEKISTLLGEK